LTLLYSRCFAVIFSVDYSHSIVDHSNDAKGLAYIEWSEVPNTDANSAVSFAPASGRFARKPPITSRQKDVLQPHRGGKPHRKAIVFGNLQDGHHQRPTLRFPLQHIALPT
jgi:hypothetical protein